LSKLFVKKRAEELPETTYQRNVYKYALTFRNYGFMGNFLALGVWGSDFFYKYFLFTFLIGIICSSWGLYILIPKEKNSGMIANLKKGLINPPVIALLTGMIIGLCGLTKYMPQFMITAFDNAGKCQGPVAMVLAGFVIGGYNFKELIGSKKVYIISLFRLIVSRRKVIQTRF
jgi:predicted permease